MKNPKTVGIVAIAVLAIIAIYLAGQPGVLRSIIGGANPTPNGTVTIAIVYSTFQPQVITVNRNTTVIWDNQDGKIHFVTSDTTGNDKFSSGNLGGGQTFSHVFNVSGTFGYHDDVTQAKGVVNVN